MGRSRLLALIGLYLPVSILLTMMLAGCKETTIDDHPCPPGGTSLDYENFGRGFVAAHCQICHGAPSKDRKGAPSAYDFGSIEDIRRYKDRIFSRAAADNTTMPPGPDDPPLEDRYKLADWLACGAP